jgi:hypothetical protein
MNNKVRTFITFMTSEGAVLPEIMIKETIPNVALGHMFAFDHPSMDKSFRGYVTNIQHVVYLDPEKLPVTYIDVSG